MLKILVILGSIREGRAGDKVSQWVINESKNRPQVKYELLDLKEYPMKLFAEPGHPAMYKANTSDENANNGSKKLMKLMVLL